MRRTLEIEALRQGRQLTQDQLDRFCLFGKRLLEKNQVMNLTAITEPQAVAQLHFLDSLAVLDAVDCRNKTVIDVGCGAGFPGVPMAIGEPSVTLTLLDSLQKRMRWLEEILPEIGVSANVVSGRAEEYVAGCREQYDIAVSRAVARLPVLAELCLPYVKTGGYFLALKGAQADMETEEASAAIKKLGGHMERIYRYSIADAVHCIVVIKKLRPAPRQYPRKYARIRQSPL